MVNPDHVLRAFENQFSPGGTTTTASREGMRLFRAPGRVNLIGEHTDYNDGFVLPVAIDRDTVIAARPRSDTTVRVYSMNRKELATFDLQAAPTANSKRWLSYIEGVARVIASRGVTLRGADVLIESDVPTGAGLSSSAALEISTAFMLTRLAGHTMDRKAMALAGQEAEHVYVGAMVGIMDQFISALGEQDHALLIDCRTLEATPIHIDTSEHALVICNTGVKHDLATSAYNDRRRECEEAVEMLRHDLPGITALRDVSMEQFKLLEQKLPHPQRERAKHVIGENERTLAAAEAFRSNDFELAGRLMSASHDSLRLDYEVSAPELDLLVEQARKIPGVFGTRMTGGGFGGCTVSFVERERLSEFTTRMTTAYLNGTGRQLTIYTCEIGSGAEELVL